MKSSASVLGFGIWLSLIEGQLYYLLTLEGKAVDITIERHKDQRTLNQNAYLWGVCYKLICDYTGDDPESFHEWAKDKFLGKKTVMVRGEE